MAGREHLPAFDAITNITVHYPGGMCSPVVTELQSEQASYHRRDDGEDNGRPAPFSRGYDVGYNATIDLAGEI